MPSKDVAHAEEVASRLRDPIRVAERPVSPYLARAWTAEDGLPVNSVTAIEQTADGYLWLGTFGGLARFDGVSFRTETSTKVLGLGIDRVVSLHEGRDGTLWIGTQRNGVFRLRDGVFSPAPWADALPHPRVWKIHEGRDGTLWISTSGAVVRVTGATATTVLRAQAGRAGSAALAILDGVDGPTWLGTFTGSALPSGADGLRLVELGAPEQVDVRAVARDGAGGLWIGTQRRGLLRLRDGRLEPVALDEAPEPFLVSALLADPDGTLWVGTEGAGLYRLEQGDLRRVELAAARADTSIRVLRRDREGNVWVGTEADGLHRLSRPAVVPHVPAEGPRLSLVPIVGDGTGGVWAGATCGGLLHFHDGVFERYTRAQGLPDRCIWALHRDPDGTLWVGTNTRGLLRLRGDRLTLLSGRDGLVGQEVRAILRDRAGILWVGTESALHRLGADGRVVAWRLPVRPAFVNSIVERRAGGLWLATDAGLFRFVNGAFARAGNENGPAGGPIRDLLEDPDGTLWAATYGGGLLRLARGRVTRYGTARGLYNMFLSRILDDGRGRLWLSSNRGVFHVTRAELDDVANGRATAVTSVWFDRDDGMPSSETNGGGQPAGWRTADGHLWFPTIDGLIELDPAQPRNPHRPPVVIRRVVADRHAIDPRAPIELAAGTRTLEIHYAALSYRAPEKVRYRYRLDGYDQGWIDAGTRRAAYYTDLEPGRYAFRVRARNEDGVWSAADAVLPIRQNPHFYQRAWFLALSVLLVATAVVVGHRLRLRDLVRRAAKLEAAVAARTAEVVAQRDQLAEKHRKVEKAHGDLLTIFDQTGVGVCLIDGTGAVEFLSVTAEKVLGQSASASGRPWQEVLRLSAEDLPRVEAQLALPAAERTRQPVSVSTGDRRRYWIELDVRDDPRDARHRIFYLHDVTELYDLQGLLEGRARFQGMVGETAPMRVLYRQIRDLAAVDSTVILEGETGTGKELAAHAIHDLSARRGRPFVAVNCAGLTESLLTSQLFGHRRGAFTGAVSDQIGLFEAASGGTLLLDEIGDIPAGVQASLLRVLEAGEITRVGESRPRRIDVRIIAATHRDLEAEVVAGSFRQDLYFRLRVACIRVPPLRERREDIPELVAWFLAQLRAKGHARVYEVSREAMNLLLAHPWPGNVRELLGMIESAALGAQGPMLEVTDLPAQFLAASPDAATGPVGEALDSHKRSHVLLALERTHGNRSAAARLLGIGRNTLYRRLRELRIDA